MVHVIVIINPFDAARGRKDYYEPWEKDKPLCMYHSEKGEKVYAVNGVRMEPTDTVEDGQEIVVAPLINGGHFGKFFKGILGIGLIIAGAAIGGGIWVKGLATGLRLGTAMALSMIGSHIVNKLTPQPKVDLSNTEQENTYGWGEPQTLTGQGYVLPIVYGTVKTAGLMLQRHVLSDGRKQYLNILYCLAEGELDDITDIKLNSNPIENFSDVNVSMRFGSNQQEIIPEFNDSYADTALAYELNPSDWHTVTLDGNTAQGIEITVSFPQGLFYSNDKGNPDWTGVTIQAEYRKKGGKDWLKIPVPNENWSYAPWNGNWKAQTTWKGYYEQECRTLVRYEKKRVKHSHHWTTKRVPVYSYSMTYDQWKAKIAATHAYDGIIRQKTNAAFYRVWGIHDLEPAQYEVRVRVAGKDRTDIRTANKVQWIGVTQVIYDDFCYPGKALLGIRALATDQLSGSDPQMTCIVTRETVQVWNPNTRDYEDQPADNPAWAAYDILHRCRPLLDADMVTYKYEADGIPKENMDYYAFSAWADMCDKAGIKFNYIYDSAMKLWDALNYPCRVGRGSIIIVGTKVSCVYDYASDPVQLFTVANIKKDSFSNEYQSTEDRANCIEVSFINKDKNYERDVVAVYGDNYDNADTVAQPVQVELMGCTDLEQAYKYGKFKLRSNKYEIRTIQFEALADAIACEIGDVITVQSDATEWGIGGRIVSVDGKAVTLDQDVEAAGGGYVTMLVRNNATDAIMKREVTACKGNTVTVNDASDIQSGCIYALGTKTQQARNFKVLSISADMNEETRTITAVEYYPELYSDNLDKVPKIQIGSDIIEPPRNLTLSTEKYLDADGIMISLVHCNWINPRSVLPIVMEISQDGRNYKYETTFNAGENTYTFNAITGKEYYVRIYSQNDIGQESKYAESSILTNGSDNPPPDVTAINVEKMASGLRRYWWQFTYPYPNDIAGFRIKYTQGKKVDWDSGTPVQAGLVTSQPYETQTVRQGTHTVMIKAVDNAGNESENFAYCVLDLGDLLEQNVLIRRKFHENKWEDTAYTGKIQADGSMKSADGKDYTIFTAFTADASGQLYLKYNIDGPAVIYYRNSKSLEQAFWKNSDAKTPFWKTQLKSPAFWKTFNSGPIGESDSFWKQYSDRVLVKKGEVIQIKLHALNDVEETTVKELEAVIDVPDRNEHFEDLTISKDGTQLPIVTPHYKTTAVHIDAIQGGAVNFQFVSRTPCIIKLIDSSGNVVDGTADVSWQGYEADI